jgi:hypothetical protein
MMEMEIEKHNFQNPFECHLKLSTKYIRASIMM